MLKSVPFVFLICLIARLSLANPGIEKAFPCPDAESIAPCTCTYSEDFSLTLDCTFIESEANLANVFEQDFPVTNFSEFRINTTTALTNLDFSLNGVTFEVIDFSPGPLSIETISDSFFDDSSSVLRNITILNSELTSFPFGALEAYSQLLRLDLSTSKITAVPSFAGNLQELDLGRSLITAIEPGTLEDLPHLTYVEFGGSNIEEVLEGTLPLFSQATDYNFYGNQITDVAPGAFYDVTSDGSGGYYHISLGFNLLTVLHSQSIPITNSTHSISLDQNQISEIEANAFYPEGDPSLDNTRMWLESNQLTVVDENVFGPIMQYLSSLDLSDNPLLCGCDIAWLVLDDSLLSKVSHETTCSNGDSIHELDLEYYELSC